LQNFPHTIEEDLHLQVQHHAWHTWRSRSGAKSTPYWYRIVTLGRSILDLLHTLKELESWRVSVIAMNGLAFDLSTPHGRMMATIIAGIAEFDRELIGERIRSGIAAAKVRASASGVSRGSGRNPTASTLKSSHWQLTAVAIV
jgi:DNA invertase Pin-like site-specific DNA recombinase